jgi:hypothetical protein
LQPRRRTIGASNNLALLGGMKARNNGRYNGDGRHWETPPEVFDPLHAEFGFTIDVCATAATAKVPRFFAERGPFIGATGCIAFDGLAQSWAGERVWMNCPYGAEIYAWTRKARMAAQGGGARCRPPPCVYRSRLVARRRDRSRRGALPARARPLSHRRTVPRERLLSKRRGHLATDHG